MDLSVIRDDSGDDIDPAAGSISRDDPIRLSESSSLAAEFVVDDNPLSSPPEAAAGGTAAAVVVVAAAAEEDPQFRRLRNFLDPDGNMDIELLTDIYLFESSSPTSSSAVAAAPSRWEQCQPALSRPGVVNVGSGRLHPVGKMDEIELESQKIIAFHQIQDTLKTRLEYDLEHKKKEVDLLYEEEKRMLESSTNLDPRKIGKSDQEGIKMIEPRVKIWEAPSDELLWKEPVLPPPTEPLPLPQSFFEEGLDDGIGGICEIAVGRLVDQGDDEEEKLEEDVSVADGPRLGPYDHVVQCWECREALRINIEVGLVVCPRCRTICPTTNRIG